MARIQFEATFNDGRKLVDLSQPNGGGGGYHVMVGGYYWGSMIKYTTGWYFSGNRLETEDICILAEMIEAAEANEESAD